MFTGIIEQQGEIIANDMKEEGCLLRLCCDFDHLMLGESIAVNGVCLTVLSMNAQGLCFDISPETLQKTKLGLMKPGDKLNLERAMQANARFGGHYVSGHVDMTAKICEKKNGKDFVELCISGFQSEHMKYLLPKGSITVDGVSLTINAVDHNSVHLMLIPHTLDMTNLDALQVGHSVNIEFDYLTRIVAHQLQFSGQLTSEVDL